MLQVADEDQKFVEKFLMRKKFSSLEFFYFEIARYYARNRITDDFIQNMYECLKLKVKKEFNGTPFQVYIMQSSF